MANIVLDRATYLEFPNNAGINIRNIQIESGSLLLEEILCDGNIVFGETNATRFEATVYNLPDVAGQKIRVYQTDSNGNNKRNLFEGYVDSCKQDKNGYYRKLVAYDAFYSIGNANVAGWWLLFWNLKDSEGKKTATLKELRESLCNYVQIPYETDISLHNDYFMCTKTATLSSVSFNTMLSWICEIQCTVPHIDRNGKLQFVSLAPKSGRNISNDYDRNSSEFEGFITAAIDKVELYDYDNNLVATTDSTPTNTTNNVYTLKDNSLLFSLVGQNATEFVMRYLEQVRQIRYTPCDVDMIVSNLDILVGDYITVGDTTSIVLQNTLSGPLLVEQEIQATGSEYLQDSSRTLTAEYLSIEKKTDNLKNEIITDDLLNYSHTNDTAYEIFDIPAPVIALSATLPKSSNFVFLATINLESYSEVTEQITETVTISGTECEMVRTVKKPVEVEAYYEWGGAEVLTNKPTETYSEDGKHLMNLMFFSIGGREVGSSLAFRVFLSAKNGKVLIGKHQINATIISKGVNAGSLPWDGTVTVTDNFPAIEIEEFTPTLGTILESVNVEV